jgi:hypothetical protein
MPVKAHLCPPTMPCPCLLLPTTTDVVAPPRHHWCIPPFPPCKKQPGEAAGQLVAPSATSANTASGPRFLIWRHVVRFPLVIRDRQQQLATRHLTRPHAARPRPRCRPHCAWRRRRRAWWRVEPPPGNPQGTATRSAQGTMTKPFGSRTKRSSSGFSAMILSPALTCGTPVERGGVGWGVHGASQAVRAVAPFRRGLACSAALSTAAPRRLSHPVALCTRLRHALE